MQVRHAADEAAKLDEASRQISLLAAKGAHEAATSAAQSLGGDPRNIEVLAQVADEAIKTMNDVIDIERQVAAATSDPVRLVMFKRLGRVWSDKLKRLLAVPS